MYKDKGDNLFFIHIFFIEQVMFSYAKSKEKMPAASKSIPIVIGMDLDAFSVVEISALVSSVQRNLLDLSFMVV